jgi:glutamate formiminotransferase
MAAGELVPDFGPARLDPRTGAVLVAARPPLVAFNIELAPPAGLEDARAIATSIREGGPDGLPGLRALGVWLAHRETAQVSMNLEDHRATSLADVVAAIARRADIAAAELVGLAPSAAFDGFPSELTVRGRRSIEDALVTPDLGPADGAPSD